MTTIELLDNYMNGNLSAVKQYVLKSRKKTLAIHLNQLLNLTDNKLSNEEACCRYILTIMANN